MIDNMQTLIKCVC